MDREKFLALPNRAKQLNKMRMRLTHLREMAAEISAVKTEGDRVQSSSSEHSRQELIMDRVLMLEDRIRSADAELACDQREAITVIRGAGLAGEAAEVMELRYGAGLLWEDVARIAYVSESWCMLVNRESIERIFPDPL